jgi:Asp-tRNA(Asn)/Glu-tRNA(Gln) amidotransferase A subunit family amidase
MDDCAPEAVLGPLPVIYPFIVNNPGEAAQAKRRICALTIGHMTPPLTQAGSHGVGLEIEGLFDEYAIAESLDPKRARLLAQAILARAKETGLFQDSGLNDGAGPADALRQLDAWLCDLKDMRIAFAPTFPGFPVAADIRDAVEKLAQQLDRLGAIVEEAALPKLDFNQELSRAGELIGMAVGAFQPEENKPPTTLAQYLEALHRRDQSIIAWEQFFDEWDVLLCPPSMTTAFPHCETGSPLQVNGQKVDYWMVSAHSTLFNYTGHPAIVLPYKLDRNGLPMGVQIVGKRWDESRLLAIAQGLSKVTGKFQRPPGYQTL